MWAKEATVISKEVKPPLHLTAPCNTYATFHLGVITCTHGSVVLAMVWATEEGQWADAVGGGPSNSCSVHSLANELTKPWWTLPIVCLYRPMASLLFFPPFYFVWVIWNHEALLDKAGNWLFSLSSFHSVWLFLCLVQKTMFQLCNWNWVSTWLLCLFVQQAMYHRGFVIVYFLYYFCG